LCWSGSCRTRKLYAHVKVAEYLSPRIPVDKLFSNLDASTQQCANCGVTSNSVGFISFRGHQGIGKYFLDLVSLNFEAHLCRAATMWTDYCALSHHKPVWRKV